MSRSWKDSDGPTLLSLFVVGFAMGVIIALVLLGRNKHSLSAVILIGGGLVALCGGFATNSQGSVRAAFATFAAIGAGMITTGFYAMQ